MFRRLIFKWIQKKVWKTQIKLKFKCWKYQIEKRIVLFITFARYSIMRKKIQIAIMIITLGIFLVPTGVFAYINLSHQSEKNCCPDNPAHSQSDCCKNHKNKDKEEKDCDGTCGNLACHCPSTTTLSINYPVTSEETNAVVLAAFKNLWNYAKQQPKPVYFQIWSPPKLS